MKTQIFQPSIDTTLNSPQSLLLKRILKDKGRWDGCDRIEKTEWCRGCKYEKYCEGLMNAQSDN